ncbi:DNA cytosine methyltransferase [Macrococcus equipercicus]|uniref:Cytosine-specific methyltransferase n=1 Tax=Macrococcus equipercicus TaxID=69967 RepID=A0ABQ6R7J5_9STAP|nr:DNA cytosine methyltransferase [Macrococcus equipercicus]KAA1039066.1 DNA cytosine methyltransferase [Macrococcus equipercicus]
MPYAIDLFCGAGGFSEGILQAGFDIVFSSDKSPMAQQTYTNRHTQLGILDGIDTHFELADIKELTAELIFDSINRLKYGSIFEVGSIDAIFGGPPCQGFSRLGKRNSSDPRNMLFHEYLRIIRDVRPKYVVMENVTGILDMSMLDFPSVIDDGTYEGQHLVPSILKAELNSLGYNVLDIEILNAANYGVPQQRNRAIFLAYRNDVSPIKYPKIQNDYVTVHDAFGDLYSNHAYSTNYSSDSVKGRTNSRKTNLPIKSLAPSNMEVSKHDELITERFSLFRYGENRIKVLDRIRTSGINLLELSPRLFYDTLFQLNNLTNVQTIKDELEKLEVLPTKELTSNWLTLTNKQLSLLRQYDSSYSLFTTKQFNQELSTLSKKLGISIEQTLIFWNNIKDSLNTVYSEQLLHQELLNGNITDEIANSLLTKKNIRSRLNPESISPTMVTLPDDYIHPDFNRILTVREMARLQSFDDSFEFLGKRTTGGSKRALETPQFTQVGNAVPPLLAKAVADEVMKALMM